MKRKWQIISLSVSFVLGIIIAANYIISVDYILFTLIILASIASLIVVKSKLGYLLFVSIGLLLGIIRFDLFSSTILPSAHMFDSQKVSVVGRVSGEPRWDEYRNYVFYLSNPSVGNTRVHGLVRIKTTTGNISEGQLVRATGKLKSGQGKAETYISYAKTEIIDSNQPLNVQIKQLFIRGLHNTLPDESVAFMSGILIGSRSALPKEYTDILLALGLSHIVAVSGYNLTILIGFLNKRLSKNWRWGGLVASLWIVLGFVIISGASASILRAGIMSSIFLIAIYYGRRLNLVVCLSITAAMMVAVQPQSVLSDLGWQLSFLSLFGITILAPKISKILPSKPKLINDILSVTLAAQIATSGLVIYKFGQISLLAPLSNLIVIPIIPFLMLLGSVAAIIGLLLPQFAYVYFGRFVHYIFITLFDFLAYLSKWQLSVFRFSSFKLSAVFLYYITVCIFAVAVRGNSQHSFIGINHDKIVPERNSLNELKPKGELGVRT